MKSSTKTVLICLLLVCTLQPATMISAQGESWLDGWDYRTAYIITGSIGAGSNYQVVIDLTYDANMQIDFDDLRFTAVDGITEWDYWIEEYIASTTARVWLEVRDDLDYGGGFWMYYGNSTVSTTSNGDNTFYFYEDWTSESVRAAVWDITSGDGGISYAASPLHGKTARVEGTAGATYKITSDYDTASPTALMFRAFVEEAGTGNTGRIGSGHDGAFAFSLVDTTSSGEQFYVFDDDGNEDSQSMTASTLDRWTVFQITRDGTNSKLYADTALIKTASCDPDIITTNPIASLRVTDSEDDIYSDWFAGRKFVTTEPVVVSGDWNDISEAELIFPVGWNPAAQFGYDAAFIFLGLIMFPVSTLYLVKGGRKDMNMDKVFMALVIFALGCGFLIGGIIP